MPHFLVTILLEAESLNVADDIACAMSEDVEGHVHSVTMTDSPSRSERQAHKYDREAMRECE